MVIIIFLFNASCKCLLLLLLHFRRQSARTVLFPFSCRACCVPQIDYLCLFSVAHTPLLSFILSSSLFFSFHPMSSQHKSRAVFLRSLFSLPSLVIVVTYVGVAVSCGEGTRIVGDDEDTHRGQHVRLGLSDSDLVFLLLRKSCSANALVSSRYRCVGLRC